jgi:hypothetical protein
VSTSGRIEWIYRSRGPEDRPSLAASRRAVFGAGVWVMSYVQLVPMGLYQPPWEHPPRHLAMDLSYHLAYGGGLGADYAALDRG